MSRAVYDFANSLRFDDIPPQVQHQAKRCLLDLIGVAAAGRETPLSKIIHDHAAEFFGAGSRGARMIFDGRKVSAAGAALAGGMTIDSIDGHDGHPLTKGHAGCGVLPALLAFVDAGGLNLSGQEFLTALVVGYELSIRAGIALHATAPDYHTSGAWVAVGICAMAVPLLGLSYEQFREAMGIAEYHGPRSQMMRTIDAPTMVKDGSGWGAMAGVSASYLGQNGFTGAPAITVEAEEVAEYYSDLGTKWHSLGQYFKPYPVCRWGQPPVECVKQLHNAHGFGITDIAQIEVNTFHQACRLACGVPENTEQAQYNLPFSVAAYLRFGQLGPAEVGAKGIEDPTVRNLIPQIKMVEEQTYNDLFPAERWARVNIILKNGQVLASEPSVGIGNAENPLSDEDLNAKFKVFCTAGQIKNASQISDCVWALDDAPSLRPFLNLLLCAR